MIYYDDIQGSADNVHEPAANTDAEIVYAAETGKRHVITGPIYSYDALPSGGSLTVKDGTDTILAVSINNFGERQLVFEKPMSGTPGQSMTITLAAGGAGVTGKLTIPAHWTKG